MARKCGYCNQEGHNARTCPKKAADKAAASATSVAEPVAEPVAESVAEPVAESVVSETSSTSSTKKTRMCGFCKKHGHNKKTCPERKALEAAKSNQSTETASVNEEVSQETDETPDGNGEEQVIVTNHNEQTDETGVTTLTVETTSTSGEVIETTNTYVEPSEIPVVDDDVVSMCSHTSKAERRAKMKEEDAMRFCDIMSYDGPLDVDIIVLCYRTIVAFERELKKQTNKNFFLIKGISVKRMSKRLIKIMDDLKIDRRDQGHIHHLDGMFSEVCVRYTQAWNKNIINKDDEFVLSHPLFYVLKENKKKLNGVDKKKVATAWNSFQCVVDEYQDADDETKSGSSGEGEELEEEKIEE